MTRRQATIARARRLDDENAAGCSNRRLPNIRELERLVDAASRSPAPAARGPSATIRS